MEQTRNTEAIESDVGATTGGAHISAGDNVHP